MMKSLHLYFVIESEPWTNFLFLVPRTHVPGFHVVKTHRCIYHACFLSDLLCQLLIAPRSLELYVIRSFEIHYLGQLSCAWWIIVVFFYGSHRHSLYEVGNSVAIIVRQLISHLLSLLGLSGFLGNDHFRLVPSCELVAPPCQWGCAVQVANATVWSWWHRASTPDVSSWHKSHVSFGALHTR